MLEGLKRGYAVVASMLGTSAGVSGLGELSENRVQLELLEGAEHADPRFEAPDNVSRVLDFIDKQLANYCRSM